MAWSSICDLDMHEKQLLLVGRSCSFLVWSASYLRSRSINRISLLSTKHCSLALLASARHEATLQPIVLAPNQEFESTVVILGDSPLRAILLRPEHMRL